MMRDALARILENCPLLQASAAANALRAGWKIEVHHSSMPYEQLADIYSLRAERLRRMSSAHATQLAESMDEFIANLNRFRHPSHYFFTEEHEFDVFCSESNEPLGCLRTVSKLRVSAERWNEIWS
jgi:hypothetical protein